MNPNDVSEKIWIRAISSKKSTDEFNPTYNYVYFFDFKWNVSIVFHSKFLEIYMPSKMVGFASGLLVDGKISSLDSSNESKSFNLNNLDENNDDDDVEDENNYKSVLGK